MTTQQFTISAAFAMHNNMPCAFVAETLIETTRAFYVFGHGDTHPQGACARCGRTLTHPGSILIGIGPDCLADWGARDARLENMGPEDIARLKALTYSRIVDTWIPKAIIKSINPSEQVITVPPTHPKLKPRTGSAAAAAPTKSATAITFKLTGDPGARITFPYNVIDLENVKKLPGRRFHNEGADKFWTIPATVKSLNLLKEWGFALDADLENFLTAADKHYMPQTVNTIAGLKMSLFRYQLEGVNFIEATNGRTLVADEMGLGKTAQALAWLQLHPELRPAIVVVPASLKLNWAQEARMWMSNPQTQILSGTDPNTPITGEIIIINYDILPNQYKKFKDANGKKKEKELPRTGWVDYLKDLKPRVLIFDECHYFKNNDTHRTKAVKSLAKSAPHVLCLSGTPIVNRPIEAYNALKIIDPENTPSVWEYGKRYCDLSHDRFGWDFSGASNTDELHKKLTSSIMIRRIKADVLTDLPDKLYSLVPLEMTNAREYRTAEKDLMTWIHKNKGALAAKKAQAAKALVQIETLKQIAVNEKMEAAIQWIKNFLEVDGKLIVFAVHTAAVDRLMEEFGPIAVKIDGSTPTGKRQAVVEQFQNNPAIRLFVGNIRAAGVGITLTAASNVAFLELPWTPGELSQAEDRAHRISQKDTVNVYFLIAAGTIENAIAEMLEAKRGIVDAVTDGIEDSRNIITQLISRYLKGN